MRDMNTILILYATLTGTTREITSELHTRLTAAIPDATFVLASVREITIEDLSQYKQIIFGNSTWDHGIPSPDGEVFLQELVTKKPDLSGVTVAQFGVGDSAYSEFCGALPLVKHDLELCKAAVYAEDFLIDGYPNEATLKELTEWAKQFLESTT